MPTVFRTTPESNRRELYAESAVLSPLESPNQFVAFFEELCQELKPVGLLEEDQVATIAKLLWRKHRLKIFRDAGQARAEFHRAQRENSVLLSATERALILARYIEEEEEAEKLASKTETSGPPNGTRADEVEESADEKAQAVLRDVTVERHINDLEMMERLDVGAERALGRLQKYQTLRRTGSLSPRAAGHRAPAWGRVRQ
jgi:hypothetical protein